MADASSEVPAHNVSPTLAEYEFFQREEVTPHTADDGYCIAECPHGKPSPPCGLHVVRPGKFQCWCDGEFVEVQKWMDDLRERAVRRAYGRIYPGLAWENASEVGLAEANEALTADDVLAVVETNLLMGAPPSPWALRQQSECCGGRWNGTSIVHADDCVSVPLSRRGNGAGTEARP